MPKRQVQDGEVFEGVAAKYVHGAAAVSEVAADLSDGIREMVAVNLLPGTVWSLRYTSHDFPTIENVLSVLEITDSKMLLSLQFVLVSRLIHNKCDTGDKG